MTMTTTCRLAANGTVMVLQTTLVGDVTTNRRYSLPPGADLTGQPASVIALAATAWTPSVLAAYEASKPRVPTPSVVSMRKARLALLGAGLLANVNAAIAAMPGAAGEAARIEWEYAAEVDRNSPLVSALSAMLSLSEAQLDGLFIAAAALP